MTLDADNAKNRLKLLNELLDKKKKKDLKGRHTIEKGKLDEDFEMELENLNSHWEDKIGRYKEECTKLEEMLLDKQRNDFQEYEDSIDKSLPNKFKESAKLLESRGMV